MTKDYPVLIGRKCRLFYLDPIHHKPSILHRPWRLSLRGRDDFLDKNNMLFTDYSWAHSYDTKEDAIDDIVKRELMTKAEILIQLVFHEGR